MVKFMNKGLTVPKWDQKYPKFIQPICQIGRKVWNIVEKRLHQTSVIRGCKERKIAKKKKDCCKEKERRLGLA